MATHLGLRVVLAALMVSVTACGGGTSTESESAAPAADASHTGHAAVSRVFFVEPQDGATVGSEVKLQFGSEGVTIAAVPPGEVTEARPGMVHYHVAPDADCLPAGTIIPRADPWVHFGKGDNSAEISLSPGPHRLTVQAGDDLHRSIEGLCQTINVTAK